MSIVDILVIVFIALGAIVGFKNGAIKTGASFIGIVLVTIISFVFKDQLMVLLYQYLPFFNFFGLIKGLTVINILFYQIVSFLIIFIALTFILKVIVGVTGILEWMLKKQIFLSLPLKIIGCVIGAVQYYIYVFLILYILNFPVFNLTYVNESQIGNEILKNTPIISQYVDGTVTTYNEVYKVLKNRKDKTNEEINTEVLIILLNNKLISVESAKKLVFQNKIFITDESILDNYEESEMYKRLYDIKDNALDVIDTVTSNKDDNDNVE